MLQGSREYSKGGEISVSPAPIQRPRHRRGLRCIREGALKDRIRKWYEGTFEPYENDPNSGVFFVGGNYRRHWTAEAARAVVAFWLAHWQWTIGNIIAVIGLFLALGG